MEYITYFSSGTPNPALLGGKGSNLIKLTQIGVNVPPGFIINTNAYKFFLEESDYNNQLKGIFSSEMQAKEILTTSTKIMELISQSTLSSAVMEEIETAYDKICEKINSKVSFAVRSSATIEDSSKFSFAGQADSFLYNHSLEDIFISLKKCWASLFSPRALLYFLQMKKRGVEISLNDVEMAVVIQKMVNSEISGVLFTANIVNNDESQMYLNSTWGLGGTIADNTVNPDTIIMNKDIFKIIKIIIGEKEKKSVQNPKASGTIMIETEQHFREICSLNENLLCQLHELGIKIENTFHYPQDIELGIEKDVIYILQTRPITTLKR